MRGRFGARGSVPRLRLGLCPLLLGQPPWRHPGPRGPGGLTASPEKWAWPGSSTAQRRLSRALPRATWRGRLGAVLCLRDTQEANAVPSLAEPGPSATGPPCVHKHAGQSRRAGGAAGAAPPPCRWGRGRGGGRSGSEAGARTQPCSVTRAGCPDHRAPGLPHPAGLARLGRPSALRRLFSLQGTSLVCPPVPPLWLHPPAPRTPVATDVTSGACSTSPQVTDFTNWRRVCSLPRLCLRPHRPKRGSRAWQRAPHVRTSGWGLRATRAADRPAGSARPGGGAGRPPWAPAELEACSTFSLIYSSKLHVPQVVRGTLWVGFLQGVNSLRRSDLFFHRRPGRGWSRWPLQFRFHLRLK